LGDNFPSRKKFPTAQNLDNDGEGQPPSVCPV